MNMWTQIFLVALAIYGTHASSSCYTRCGDPLDNSHACQCNDACLRYGDCCSDYNQHCVAGSCQGRCGATNNPSMPCQCNSVCSSYGDCCSDYNNLCNGGGGPDPTDPPGPTSAPGAPTNLNEFGNAVWNADVNRVSDSDMVLDFGNYISNSGAQNDVSPNRLFTSINTAVLNGPTYQALMAMFDNYITAQGTPEVTTAAEQAEQNAFMDAIFNTAAMDVAFNYVNYRGFYSSVSQYKEFVRGLIFTPYNRKSTDDTSGFEHIFLGEWSSSSSVSGFHNWVRMYLLEQNGNVMNYYGNMNIQSPRQIKYQFEWEGRVKPITSIVYGVSPEFELAVFSVCFLERRNSQCHMTMGGGTASVQTWDRNGANIFGSAYFIA